MKAPRIAEDIVAIARFKNEAAHWLKHIEQTGQPLVITQHGHAAGVLIAPAEFDRLVERQRFLEQIIGGLEDALAGRTLTTAQVLERLAQRRRELRDTTTRR